MRTVLAVGGSDSGGGAGVQADVRTLHALGVHAATAVTAVTAQDTTAVHAVHVVPEDVLRAQVAAVLADLRPVAVKTGMLATAGTVRAVAELVAGLPLVVDPVGVSSTGGALLTADGLDEMRDVLLPLALVVTPNLAEVQALTGFAVRTEEDLREGARRVHALGPRWVLVKGGHLSGDPVDLLYDGSTATALRGPRLASPHTHGTGCTLASALAAHLAAGCDVPTAAARAKEFTAAAIEAGYPVGAGAGPVRQLR